MKATTNCLATMVLCVASTTWAQSVGTVTGAISSPPLYQNHASTVEEGVLRGTADAWRALGDYQYNASLAAVNAQEAQRRALENSTKYVETYFTNRRLNKELQTYTESRKPTQDEMNSFAKSRAPKRLSTNEFEPVLGMVYWPAILRHDAFAAERNEIDGLFASRTTRNSGLGSDNYRQIREVTERLQDKLRTRMSSMSSAEYVVAKKFVTSLELESRQPATSVQGIAASY